ncbi:SDR family oxidoreductase [Streptomyces sp. SP17KL33]|uniref:SDR family oxidoreductase n=1 Tax=Streptomyces sp. SP17KL33 TaxID=3002534 RepID=UPI002E781CBB|nr:SDR family oxidoreductase [Streptomyces sp. SP17KL33]MEE1835924.1 SDR family oxidoreductase [Streptomyces sp. SP17KL33]
MSGTGRGRGRAAPLRFAAECAIVVGGDLGHEFALKAQRLVTKAGGTALTSDPLDATDGESSRAWVEEAADAFGDIDILYANADAVRFGAVDTQPYEDFGCTLRAELDSVGPAGSLTNQRTASTSSRLRSSREVPSSSPPTRRPASPAPTLSSDSSCSSVVLG